MDLVADEYGAADSYYFFSEPLYYRYPTNTDELFSEYINNPNDYEEFDIPKSYLGQRFHDLKNDLGDLKFIGETQENHYKIRYYTGLVAKLKELFFSTEELAQHDIAEHYNAMQRKLKQIKEGLLFPASSISSYYYNKGMSDICRQIILNIPIIKHE